MTETTEEQPVFHWGKWVSRSEPITGVANINDISSEAYNEMVTGAVDLDWERYVAECEKKGIDPVDSESEYEPSNDLDMVMGFLKGEDGLYDVDPSSDFSAVIQGDPATIHVVRSAYVQKAALCSPCCPGQADLSNTGEFLAYALPTEFYDPEYNDVPEVYVWDIPFEINRVVGIIKDCHETKARYSENPRICQEAYTYLETRTSAAKEYVKSLVDAFAQNEPLLVKYREI